jgi:hypothetical protein
MKIQPAQRQKGQELLERMGQIPVIVQGKLSQRYGGGNVTGHKLQRWRDGRNQTRHIAEGRVEVIRQGTQGYKEFLKLSQEYVEVREQEALQASASPDSKKKSMKR